MAKSISFIKEKSLPTISCENNVSSCSQLQLAREIGAEFGGNFSDETHHKSDEPVPTFLKINLYWLILILKGLFPEFECER